MKNIPLKRLSVPSALVVIVLLAGCVAPIQETPAPAEPPIAATRAPVQETVVEVLLDDFKPQPYQGNPVYFYNRLEGDRGAINEGILEWGKGNVRLTIAPGMEWGGVWMSLNHPIREGLPIDFSAVLPPQVQRKYQARIAALHLDIADGTPGRIFKVELKNGDSLQWSEQVTLTGGSQSLSFDLPPIGPVNHFVWVLDRAQPGDSVVLERVSFTAKSQWLDTPTAAFVWSYGMLLENWNPATGLARDKARDGSGEFDAIQATGSLAAATAVAYQLGVVSKEDAVRVVNQIGDVLLNRVPRHHGLLPHWVKALPGDSLTIVENTEWSSVDTVIAILGLLEAQTALGLDPSGAEQLLWAIDWQGLVTTSGISHGYTYAGELIPYAWDAFGGESWLVQWAHAGATGSTAPMAYPDPPTANGSGFIDELAWLFAPPPSTPDHWGTDWTAYRSAAADRQVSFYPEDDPASCFSQLGLFGLSAGEVPAPSTVSLNDIYQAYGVGGAFAPANDGSQFGAPVVAPHYAAMAASLHPTEAIAMWDWLIANGFFSPLNNVESLMFPTNENCGAAAVEWNPLKGSWNLSLQTLGWGRYLAERDGHKPILWQAVEANPLLQKGYDLLSAGSPSTLVLTPFPRSSPALRPWSLERECENPDEATVGTTINRANASGLLVHGQFGTVPAWPAKPGYAQYNNIVVPQTGELYLKLRYSKYSPATTPILVTLDNEAAPRATIQPNDQGDWNTFAWTDPIPLGSVESGVHSLRFFTEGQQYGVADLDVFILTTEP